MSITRTGNKLCGTSTREFQHTTDSQTCILDETDKINGEVTAKGQFWVDLDFDWKQKRGICTALTLPCSGKVTWEFVIGGYDVKAGSCIGTLPSVPAPRRHSAASLHGMS